MIHNLITKWHDKIHKEYNGGFKYGHDYNILKAIVENLNDDKRLIKRLVESLKDKMLMDRVKTWMAEAVA